MKLTRASDYALGALVHLVRAGNGSPVPSHLIADAHGIPERFLVKVLRPLVSAGILRSIKGPGGGYRLARPPNQIRIGHVIRTIDGPLAPIACASRTAYQPCGDCKDVRACTVRRMMTRVRDAMSDVLDRMTIADMIGAPPQRHRTIRRRSGKAAGRRAR